MTKGGGNRKLAMFWHGDMIQNSLKFSPRFKTRTIVLLIRFIISIIIIL